jgi:very-short-patch-repair endonuclease
MVSGIRQSEPLTPTLSLHGRGSEEAAFIVGSPNSDLAVSPLTLALSPEGRGDDAGTSSSKTETDISTPASPRPSGERARVRGRKARPAQVARARSLRRDITEAENRLWYHLRDRRLLGFKFVRQYPIARYFADFACREAMLVIEADGGQHTPDRDAIRDATITAASYKLLRFWNGDILSDTDSVLEEILRALPATQITKNDE